jgi:hypothetical protein
VAGVAGWWVPRERWHRRRGGGGAEDAHLRALPDDRASPLAAPVQRLGYDDGSWRRRHRWLRRRDERPADDYMGAAASARGGAVVDDGRSRRRDRGGDDPRRDDVAAGSSCPRCRSREDDDLAGKRRSRRRRRGRGGELDARLEDAPAVLLTPRLERCLVLDDLFRQRRNDWRGAGRRGGELDWGSDYEAATMILTRLPYRRRILNDLARRRIDGRKASPFIAGPSRLDYAAMTSATRRQLRGLDRELVRVRV